MLGFEWNFWPLFWQVYGWAGAITLVLEFFYYRRTMDLLAEVLPSIAIALTPFINIVAVPFTFIMIIVEEYDIKKMRDKKNGS